jgi:hypothetical protein
MPTVLKTGPYRIYARNLGFSAKELRQIERLIAEHQTEFLEAWNGYFGVGG